MMLPSCRLPAHRGSQHFVSEVKPSGNCRWVVVSFGRVGEINNLCGRRTGRRESTLLSFLMLATFEHLENFRHATKMLKR
jgi:hypothetical protein